MESQWKVKRRFRMENLWKVKKNLLQLNAQNNYLSAVFPYFNLDHIFAFKGGKLLPPLNLSVSRTYLRCYQQAFQLAQQRRTKFPLDIERARNLPPSCSHNSSLSFSGTAGIQYASI